MSRSIIKAQVTGGKYKDSNFEINFGPDGATTFIKCNGKDMRMVQSVSIHARVGKETKIVIISLGD